MSPQNPTSEKETPMKNIELELNLEEANLILEALGNLPFSRVYALIAKIQEQASQQLNDKQNGNHHESVEESPSLQQLKE